MVALDKQSDSYARSLSGGMKRRLLIAKALVHQPPILFLDEPTAGVDLELRQQLWENVKLLNKQGVTVILTTHYLMEAEEMCDRIGILSNGNLVALDTTKNLIDKIQTKIVTFTLDKALSLDITTLNTLKIISNNNNKITVSYEKSKLKIEDIILLLSKQNIKILDIGCGGGLLCEPMSRLGAEVFGMDASEKNIEVAKIHAKKSNLNIKYFCSSPEKFKSDLKFDVILNMEIVEHVEDVDFFLKSCTKILKKNGIMFVATLNKTLKSYIFAIVGAEYILRWLPIGTHEWDKFLDPNELVKISKKYNLHLKNLDGMKFNIITDKWSISSDKSINYIGKFNKV